MPPQEGYVIQMTMRSGPTQPKVRRSCAVGVIASAGGIRATIELLSSLAATFYPPIIVAQHLPRTASSLDQVLGWHTKRKVCWAEEGERPVFGQVYLCRPGVSVQLTHEGFRLRPLAGNPSSWLQLPDDLLRSMSETYGNRLAAIVLSGALPTGLRGLKQVRASGGILMAQSRTSSRDFAMPCAAIEIGKVEIFTSPSRMAGMLEIISEQWDDHPNGQ
ncbi:chemotaxis protein CheB [Bradyrhizobium sp. BRP22]|uniref:chemotaxis protein CheB n=1 Tax=Bradyrhizobium sp. BRP22 TaxID=2793821 RepID=UPI001CD64A7A|nr:chemotaxis protein CheB [Bradyrhizobium sp. BRP22]MCA1453087.1 chemotaxis protein CheB [Bradyrhizobium sp. BRP22]